MIVGDEAVLSVELRSALDLGDRRCVHAVDVAVRHTGESR